MKGKIIFVLAIVFLAVSCGKKTANFEVKGHVNGLSGRPLRLELLGKDGKITIDSTLLTQEGNFQFKSKIENPGFYTLSFGNNSKTPNTEEITLAIYPNDRIYLYVNGKKPSKYYGVQGSPDSRRIQALSLKIEDSYLKIRILGKEFFDNIRNPNIVSIKHRLDSLNKEILNKQRLFTQQFINEKPASLSSLMALYQQLGPHQSVMELPTDSTLFRSVSSSLNAIWPESEPVKSLVNMVTRWEDQKKGNAYREKRLEIGKDAPEIVLPDTSGTPIALSSLRGKYVVLNFWASWNAPSRATNIMLYRCYWRYLPKGNFDVYQVSLDKNKESIIQASKEDRLPWKNQVSDFKIWKSPAVALYGVEQLPYSVLIDPEGKILGKGLTDEELLVKLFEIYGPTTTNQDNQQNNNEQ
jgi:peroxiredoxin